MKRLRLLDCAWLLLEAPETPMHVGILLRFTPPANAAPDFIQHVVARLRSSANVLAPWDLVLPTQKLRGLIPIWLHQCYLDMDYHVQLHTLDGATPESDLSAQVSQLHGQSLERDRPLWECHVFEGLPQGQFALYMKVHHALLDGVGGLQLLQKGLTRAPEERDQPAPWVSESRVPLRHRIASRSHSAKGRPRQKSRVLAHLAHAATELATAVVDREDHLVTPYRGPASALNRRVTAQRSYATQACDLVRMKRLARLSGGSTNDVVLGLVAGALQRLLRAQNALPARSLTAAVPVSTRGRHDESVGTALSFCLANLATSIADPRARLLAIQASTQRAKDYLAGISLQAQVPFTTLLMAPFIAEQFLKSGGDGRPMFNVVVSNVPGPKSPLYLEGARLESAHPLSVLFHGQALNVTCVRYLDTINFGFTGCPDTVSGIQNLPDYIREALDELEDEFSFPHRLARLREDRRSRSGRRDNTARAG